MDQAIDRAFQQRPDLMQQLAEIRSANGRIKEARAAYCGRIELNSPQRAASSLKEGQKL